MGQPGVTRRQEGSCLLHKHSPSWTLTVKDPCRMAKMELLRALVRECLSAAAQEIFKIVERTILEKEEETLCSEWVMDNHRRLLSHAEDFPQMTPTDLKEPRIDASAQTGGCPDMKNSYPDFSPADGNDQSDQEILVAVEDDDVKQEYDLSMPLKAVKVRKPIKCPVCLSAFSSKKTMVRHMKTHPEKSSYLCQFCARRFCHQSEFIIHTRIHKGAKPYKCQDCDESFDQRDSLLIHSQKHPEDKPYQCFSGEIDPGTDTSTPACKIEGEKDSRQDGSDNGIQTIPYTVTSYDKSEFDQESLQPLCLYQIQTVADIGKDSLAAVAHIKTEPAEPDGEVSDSTTDGPPLRSVNPGEQTEGETEATHLNMRNILPRRASGGATKLIVQFESGTAEKPYKCPCCAKCFSLTKTLIRHIKIHAENKPYQCQFCARNFCQKSDLVNHTRIHTGERPYQCQDCPKSFAQKGNLVVHMRKHARGKQYQCTVCSCSFGHRSSLECHMMSHL